jgi:hypothetical protein
MSILAIIGLFLIAILLAFISLFLLLILVAVWIVATTEGFNDKSNKPIKSDDPCTECQCPSCPDCLE